MLILPAIDLKDGVCVRLIRGEFGTEQKVADDPVETAKGFRKDGAHWLHMVDLDGAKTGERRNRALIARVASSCGMKIELGGGLRALSSIADYLENGIERVILGSAALENEQLICEAVRLYSDKIAVGIDARDGFAVSAGWVRTSGVPYLELAKRVESIGVKYIIFTDISCDGTLDGPNFEQLGKLISTVKCRVIASGGIRDLTHIRALRKMGVYGAICGKSIYSGTLDLAEAIAEGGE